MIVVVALAGLESFWRSHGFAPTVSDDLELWSQERARIEDSDEQTLALLGMSRIGTGFSAKTFAAQYPDWQLVQLAVNGRRPLPAYRDLALDPHFSGVAVVAINAWDFLPGAPEQDPEVAYYRSRPSPGRRLDRRIETFLQERLVMLHPGLLTTRLLDRLRKPRASRGPQRVAMDRDRFQHTNFGSWRLPARARRKLVNGQRYIYEYVGMPSPEDWLEHTRALEPFVASLADRGGHTVFVRMPIDEALYDLDERTFPRARYWDLWQQQSRAEFVHFRDTPEIAYLDHPDLLHIDGRDAPKLTNALLDEFRRRGILPPLR